MWYTTLESLSRMSPKLTYGQQRFALMAIRKHELLLVGWFILVGLMVNIAAFNF